MQSSTAIGNLAFSTLPVARGGREDDGFDELIDKDPTVDRGVDKTSRWIETSQMFRFPLALWHSLKWSKSLPASLEIKEDKLNWQSANKTIYLEFKGEHFAKL